MFRRLLVALLVAILMIVTLGFISQAAQAKTNNFPDYETTVCWEVENWSASPKVTTEDNPRMWPQDRVDCDFPPPQCGNDHRYQTDTYWIRDKADEDYLASLTVLQEPNNNGLPDGDDETLEPHNYFITTVDALPADQCKTIMKKARAQIISTCTGAYVQVRHGIRSFTHREPTERKHVFVFKTKHGWAFPDGSHVKRKVVFEKRGGPCGGSSSS